MLARNSTRLAALLTPLLTVGCDGRPDATPAAPEPGVVLVVDGDLVLRESDLEPWDRYFDALDATMGIKYRTRELLQQHLLPLVLARRAFPEERAQQQRRADELRASADNSIALRRRMELLGIREEDRAYMRGELPLAVAAWAFRAEHLGAVSEPIETPRGFFVVAPLDLEPGLTPVGDRLKALIVPFFTHESSAFDAWLDEAQRAVSGRVDFVAPRLAGALPGWLGKS